MVISFSLFVCGHFVVPVALFRKVPPFFVFQYQIKRDMPLPVAEVHVACLTFLGFFWKKAHHERVVIVVYMGAQTLTALLLNFSLRGLLFGGTIFSFVLASQFFPALCLSTLDSARAVFVHLGPDFFVTWFKCFSRNPFN